MPSLKPFLKIALRHVHLDRQTKLANLGKLVDELHFHIPRLVHSPLPSQILSPDVYLSLMPETHPHIPVTRGKLPYLAAIKAIQFLVTTFLIPPKSTLIVTSSRVSDTDILNKSPIFTTRWVTCSEETGSNYNSLLPLNLSSKDYPVLMGIFEFEFNMDWALISKHTVTNVEYLSKPQSVAYTG